MKNIIDILSPEIKQKLEENKNKPESFESPIVEQNEPAVKKGYLPILKHNNPELTSAVLTKSFENFNDRNNPKLVSIKKILQNWDYPKERMSIFFRGKSGLGKTHLMFALFKKLAKTYYEINKSLNHQVLWFNYFDLCLSIRSNPNDYQFWKKLKNVEILFIDDVGTIKNTEVIQDYLMAIIDHRTQSDLITVWSTNLTIDELKATFSERFTSRIKESCLWVDFPDEIEDFRNNNFRQRLKVIQGALK